MKRVFINDGGWGRNLLNHCAQIVVFASIALESLAHLLYTGTVDIHEG